MTRAKGQRALAARLIEDVLTKTKWGAEALARALSVTGSQLEAYRSGTMRMSVEDQLELAAFVLGRIAECERMARRLVSQANAEAAFLAKETATHMNRPPSQFWR